MIGRKFGQVGRKLDSRSEGRGFKSRPILNENGVNAMPGSIPVHNPGSFNKLKKDI